MLARICSAAWLPVAVIGWAQLVAAASLGSRAPAAQAAALPQAVELAIEPATFTIRGADRAQQVLVSARTAEGRWIDVTPRTLLSCDRPDLVSISPAGLVRPRANGTARLSAALGGRTAGATVRVVQFGDQPPINFANQIVPIFTRLGCNGGGCHGKQLGQNGFKLSLLGFEPALDYEALVAEGRSRRLFPAAPDLSLLLLKPLGRLPHGGGTRLAAGSDEYRLIRRWIAAGMPRGRPTDPVVRGIDVWPSQRLMDRHGRQQLIVAARYSDGTTEDVTRRAQYQTNDPEIATVGAEGVVETGALSGEAAVMARYQGHVAVFRATVPLGKPIARFPAYPAWTLVDRPVARKLHQLGIVPSGLCTDAEFVRRASLDLCGTLPRPETIRRFLAGRDPRKRARLVDQLLDRPEYADFFALKWSDILHDKRQGLDIYKYGTFAFHAWIRDCFARNLPYDQFVRGIVAARGNPEDHPAVTFYRQVRTLDGQVDNISELFLGLRLQCAHCHHHPFEKWSQDDYYGLAAFFGRMAAKRVYQPNICFVPSSESIYTRAAGTVRNPRTGRVVRPHGLDGPDLQIPPGADPRDALVDWMTAPDNRFFARAICNRMWAHFFGRGIVDPLDDLRLTNPPSNPELLQALADDLVAHRYDLKHLIRVICTSRTYSLSSTPNDYNRFDRRNYSRYYPKRLAAEVLADAIAQATGTPFSWPGVPAGTRAIELPDESVASSFLDTFGRPARSSPCECERISDATIAQSLLLLNSDAIQAQIAAPGSRANQLARDPRPDDWKIEDLVLWTLGRPPDPALRRVAARYLREHPGPKPAAYQNLLWVLLNMKEFQFNY